MSEARRRVTVAIAGMAGVIAGAALAFVAADLSDDGNGADAASVSTTISTTTIPPTTVTTDVDTQPGHAPSTVEGPPGVLLVWTSGGIPEEFPAAASAVPEVDALTLVRGGVADLLRSARADGTEVDDVEPGWAIPLDTTAIDPTTFAGFIDGDDGPAVAALRPGAALLTRSSAELRGLDVGSVVELRGGALEVTAIISDRTGAAAELVVHAEDAAALGIATPRYVLVRHDPDDRGPLSQSLADLAQPHAVRFRTSNETTWMRHGDAVVPQVFIKQTFGEFTYRNLAGRDIEIDPEWAQDNITTATVPLLGEVRCNTAMVEPLTAVMGELAAMNLGHLVDPAAFAGCWVPRRITEGNSISKHAWGLAVDLNIGTNPRGSFSTQDPRLVDLMRSAGFTWGGTWLVPDPGHYELDP
jgi:D-alanyl-D-alanine carboxypeptidase